MIKELDFIDVQDILKKQPLGKNTTFLKNAHNLWFRFKNYQKNKPIGFFKDNDCVSMIFATYSKKTFYANLYEIVTLQGHEKKGYGKKIWLGFLEKCKRYEMRRLKISCTPDSLGWHLKNGLIFWAIDKQGSLKSNQPLKYKIEEQIIFRDMAIKNPKIALPEQKSVDELKKLDLETHKFSKKKIVNVLSAIKKADKYWMRKHLWITD